MLLDLPSLQGQILLPPGICFSQPGKQSGAGIHAASSSPGLCAASANSLRLFPRLSIPQASGPSVSPHNFFSLNYQAQVLALLGLCLKALRASRVQQKDPTSKPCFKAFPMRMGESRRSTTSLGPGTTIPQHAEAEVDQHRPRDQPRMQPCSHCTTNSFHFGQFAGGIC